MSEKVLHEWTTGNGNRFSVLKNGNMGLGLDRGRMALSGWEPAFSREIARLAARVTELEAENAKLLACVNAADTMRVCPNTTDSPCECCAVYDAARKEVEP